MPPTYSILMVAHNTREMVQLSTLRTLRHSYGQDARLVVVDNGSSDGTEEWLRVLAQRGDIDLIRHEKNLGHGPALETARRATNSPYLVTLDSDAFPLTDHWLASLRARLEGNVKVTGILHHRDYIHPSCLMIARQTLEELDLTFLNEKDKPSRLDVAERISVAVKERGFQIAGLERSRARRRGSVSEPVYLGSEYGGIVYHQWYSTRYSTRAQTAKATPPRVDDVPAAAIEQSLSEVFKEYHAEGRELTVVMGVRAGKGEAARRRNALICLKALNWQSLPRWRYRLVVVEQDRTPQLEKMLAPLADVYLFVQNPGAYNRGWAFNIGATLECGKTGILCLIDADLLVQPDFLARGLATLQSGHSALQPYKEVAYLDAAATDLAIRARQEKPMDALATKSYHGRVFTNSQGGCIWVEAQLYHQIGGHDERFRGWGREDREFWHRLARATPIARHAERLLHMDHPLPPTEDRAALANHRLYKQLAAAPQQRVVPPIGNRELYSGDPDSKAPATVPTPTQAGLGSREWENWHRWEIARIERIVTDEQRQAGKTSTRQRLAQLLVELGDSLLDVGCGPGAMWVHFEPHRPRFSWAGVDATQKMVAVAQRLFPEVPVYHADADSLPFENGTFDVVLLRHVLEYLPPWLMQNALLSALRVARQVVVLDFYALPLAQGSRHTTRVGENFLETRWAAAEIEAPIVEGGWHVSERLTLRGGQNEMDEVWLLRPHQHAQPRPPKISIIMPTFRRPHTLYRTVKTIQAQSYRNWELIIVDNAGDGHYHFDDARISVYCHAAQHSASYARNQGLRYASGDLVCFFDDDDDMFPDYLESFVTAFEANPRAKMVRCGMIVSEGSTNFSFATPLCCLRRPYAAASWGNRGPAQDQKYFKSIVVGNNWSENNGDIVVLHKVLCRANADRRGGLRSGAY